MYVIDHVGTGSDGGASNAGAKSVLKKKMIPLIMSAPAATAARATLARKVSIEIGVLTPAFRAADITGTWFRV